MFAISDMIFLPSLMSNNLLFLCVFTHLSLCRKKSLKNYLNVKEE
jgi:hypothetical protein